MVDYLNQTKLKISNPQLFKKIVGILVTIPTFGILDLAW